MDNWCTFTDISGCVLLPESVQVHTACGFGYCRRGFAGPGDLGGEGYYTQRLDLQHGETDHWNAYGCSRILRYHRQHADGGGDYLCSIGCDFAGDILFFSEKIIFEQTGINYGIASIVCAANQRFSQ